MFDYANVMLMDDDADEWIASIFQMLKNDSLWPKALGPLPNTLQELLELAGPEFLGGKDGEETPEKATEKKAAPEVIEFDGNQPSADKE